MDNIGNKGISIIICTRNRASLLQECLNSFTNQSYSSDKIEFLIVDNNSDDNTKEVVLQYQTKLNKLKYILETKVGLSIARNRGIRESMYNWICFMDDDAIAHKNFIERLFFVKSNYSFDAFGGMFYPWHRKTKPKWLSDDFGKMPLLRKDIGVLNSNQFIAGGICAFNKDKVIKAGGFPNEIGMRGDIVGYGEENYLQSRMRENGDIIGFDPDWKIDHLVAEYKYSVRWQLKRFFAKGRDEQLSQKVKLSLLRKFYLVSRAFLSSIFQLFKNLPKLIFNKDYYFQNYIINCFSFFYRVIGRVIV